MLNAVLLSRHVSYQNTLSMSIVMSCHVIRKTLLIGLIKKLKTFLIESDESAKRNV